MFDTYLGISIARSNFFERKFGREWFLEYSYVFFANIHKLLYQIQRQVLTKYMQHIGYLETKKGKKYMTKTEGNTEWCTFQKNKIKEWCREKFEEERKKKVRNGDGNGRDGGEHISSLSLPLLLLSL